MGRTWRPGDPGYAEAEARWRRQHGHPPADQASGHPATKARPGWPQPHPAVVARRVDDLYREVAAAVEAEGNPGQRGGCGHCTPCDVGAPQRCHNTDSTAGRRYAADQARADADDACHCARVQVELGLVDLPRS